MLRKHYIYIEDEKWDALMNGERLDGSMKTHPEESTAKVPVFNPYNRQGSHRRKLETVKHLQLGWLKRGTQFLVFHDRVPLVLGPVKAMEIFVRDIKEALEGLR